MPTISPRLGWWAGAISSARRPNVAAVSGSVVTSAFAAVEQGVDCHLVSRLGARGQLDRDLDRQGAGLEQDAGCLAVERAAGGYRHAGADRLTCDVVPEGELLVALDEQVRLEELTDRRQ